LLTIMTHMANEGDLEELVAKLEKNASVLRVNSVIRVEGI
jgi:hypothetical protein